MQAATTRLSEQQLKELANKFETKLQEKHFWCWRKDVLSQIKIMKKFNPNWTNADIYDRVGNSFVDYYAQEEKDNLDWQQSWSELVTEANLTQEQKAQLTNYFNGDTY